jgi:hypothetical protein
VGLDMYAYSVAKADSNCDLSFDRDTEREEFAYWRKFNALHNWMENYARDVYGFGGDFNCVPVRLDMRALELLKDDALNKRLVPTEGFFFGPQEIDDGDYEAVLDFCKKAAGEIFGDRDVYYDSWW